MHSDGKVVNGPWAGTGEARQPPANAVAGYRRGTYRCVDGHATDVQSGPTGALPSLWECHCGRSAALESPA